MEIARQARQQQAQRQEKIEQKYASIDALSRHEKIEALGHPDVNPFYLKNPYDGLSAGLNRWKYIANDAELSHMSPEDKDKAASNYYDAVLAPLYQKLGKPPIDKQLWLHQAYKEALDYNLDRAYDNTIWHDLKHGWNAQVPALARMGSAIYNTFEKAHAYATGLGGTWDQDAAHHTSLLKNFTAASQPEAAVNVGARRQIEEHQFWSDVLPSSSSSWTSRATSMIGEQAASLPVYAVLAAVPFGMPENLTTKLGLSAAGKKVAQYLATGGEGTAYGVLTRPKGDKHNSWQDGLGFMIGHIGFDIGGLAAKGLYKGGKTTLAQILEHYKGAGSPELEALKARQDKFELGMQGKEPATPEELYKQRKKEVATNLAVAGVQGQRAIYSAALHHIENMENVEHGNWTKQQVKEYENSLLKEDPARWSPVLAAANYVRSLIGEMKLKDIKDGSPEMLHLTSRVARLITEAAAEITQHVPEMAAEGAKEAVAEGAKGAGRGTLEYFAKQVQAEAEKNGTSGLLKPEQIQKMAEDRWQKSVTKARQEAAKALTSNPQKAVAKANKAAIKAAQRLEVRTERIEYPHGNVYARYQLNPTYKVYLTKQAKSVGISMNSKDFSGWLRGHYDGMDDADFAQHIQDNFYPKELAAAKVWFESQWRKPIGAEYPNFLAFMYNYKDKMPVEMAEELMDRLIGTEKFQEAFRGGSKTQPILDWYSQAVYNHVDDFLGSGRWPEESNIFRSTNSTVRSTTKYQKELLQEKMEQEVKQLRSTFSRQPEAAAAAEKQLRKLQLERMRAFNKSYDEDPTSRDTVKELNDLIANQITASGKFTKWRF